MKKTYIRLLALCLCLFTLAASLLSCGTSGKTLASIGKQKISVNMYQLMLSRYRGTVEYSYPEAAQNDFWDIVIDSSGTTYNDYFTATILDNVKTYACAMYVFEEIEKLKLPDGTLDVIDEEMRKMVDELADGSKTMFNTQLSQYGVNYQMLRDAYIMEAKVAYLQEQLYGTDGALLSDVVKEEYYQKNYTRFKHVFLFTYSAVYEQDANGDDIYYAGNDDSVAYDKVNGTPKAGADGKNITDENGDTVYYTADGRIAYDKKNGLRAYVYDENGYVKTRTYTADEIAEVEAKANEILAMAKSGEDFDELVEIYGEDPGFEEYTSGYYLTDASEYEIKEVKDALPTMQEGEIRLIRSDYGFHVLKKYELNEGGYKEATNADFFTDFNEKLMTEMFLNLVNQHADKVELDEELASSIEIKDVAANYYY
ncbi:MAG: peptidylprolyl isomerase [Clostridia bacterium]|nr:peptidylprolyl isomerase [Clostridia bacterium]